jgi:hypothetical protein
MPAPSYAVDNAAGLVPLQPLLLLLLLLPSLPSPPSPMVVVAVYSVGLYVDGHGAKKALHKYKGNDVDLIMDTQQVFDGGWGWNHCSSIFLSSCPSSSCSVSSSCSARKKHVVVTDTSCNTGTSR